MAPRIIAILPRCYCRLMAASICHLCHCTDRCTLLLLQGYWRHIQDVSGPLISKIQSPGQLTVNSSGDFGISGKNKFVTQDQGSSDAYSGDFIRMVFLANVAQCVLSISYLNFNSLITRLSLAKEWALMGTGFRPLRVTDPEGEQVSTHFLGLPYSWSVPCIALGILLHWLVSNSCYVFMTDGGTFRIQASAEFRC